MFVNTERSHMDNRSRVLSISMNMKEIGARIRMAREAAGMNQQQLGERCGWEKAQGRLSHYEHGRREPLLSDLERISVVLRVKLTWLIEGDGPSDLGPDAVRFCRALASATPEQVATVMRILGLAAPPESGEPESKPKAVGARYPQTAKPKTNVKSVKQKPD